MVIRLQTYLEEADSIIEHHIDRLDLIREAGDELGSASVEIFMRRLLKSSRGEIWLQAKPTPCLFYTYGS